MRSLINCSNFSWQVCKLSFAEFGKVHKFFAAGTLVGPVDLNALPPAGCAPPPYSFTLIRPRHPGDPHLHGTRSILSLKR